MVARLLGLRLALLVAPVTTRSRTGEREALGAVALLAASIAGAVALARNPDYAIATIAVGAFIVLGALVLPGVLGLGDPLDARRFRAAGGVSPGHAAALVLAGALSIPTLCAAILATGAATAAVRDGLPPALATLGVLVAALTVSVAGRVSAALGSLRGRHRTREATAAILAGGVVLAAVVVGALVWLGGDLQGRALLARITGVLALSPFGAAWGVLDGDAAAPVGARLAIACATLLVLAAALFGLTVTALGRTPHADRLRRGTGWFSFLPVSPVGVVAARSLTYWLHDRRHLANLAIVPIAALVPVVPLALVGVPVPALALISIGLAALFFGWLLHNDVAHDGTAVWTHVASGVSGTSERAGRLAPVVLIAVPVLAAAIAVAVALTGDPLLLPTLTGVAASLLGAGLGLSSIASVAAPYAAPRPGDGPFQQPQRPNRSGVLAQSAVLVGAALASLPTLVAAVPVVGAAAGGAAEGAAASFWWGIGTGAVMLAVGIVAGGAVYDRRQRSLVQVIEAG